MCLETTNWPNPYTGLERVSRWPRNWRCLVCDRLLPQHLEWTVHSLSTPMSPTLPSSTQINVLLPNFPLVLEKNFSPMPSPSENVSYTTKQLRGALCLLPWVTHSFSLTSTYRFSPKLPSHLPNLPHLSPGKGEAIQPWLEKNDHWRLGSALWAGLPTSRN